MVPDYIAMAGPVFLARRVVLPGQRRDQQHQYRSPDAARSALREGAAGRWLSVDL